MSFGKITETKADINEKTSYTYGNGRLTKKYGSPIGKRHPTKSYGEIGTRKSKEESLRWIIKLEKAEIDVKRAIAQKNINNWKPQTRPLEYQQKTEGENEPLILLDSHIIEVSLIVGTHPTNYNYRTFRRYSVYITAHPITSQRSYKSMEVWNEENPTHNSCSSR